MISRSVKRPLVPWLNRNSIQMNGLKFAVPMFSPAKPIDMVSGLTLTMDASNPLLWNDRGSGGADFPREFPAYYSSPLSTAGDGIYGPSGWSPLAGASAYTIMAWVCPTTATPTGNWSRVISMNQTGGGDDDYTIGAKSSAQFFARVSASSKIEGETASTAYTEWNTHWVHFAATWTSGGPISIWLNGEDRTNHSGESSTDGTIVSSTNNLCIGNRYGDGSRRFEGYIMDVRLYDKDLSNSIHHFVSPQTRWDLWQKPAFQLAVLFDTGDFVGPFPTFFRTP
jgi:hypothetical protein